MPPEGLDAMKPITAKRIAESCLSERRLPFLIVLALVPLLSGLTPCAAQELAAEPWEAGAVFRDCPLCPEVVVVPPGSIMMGSGSDYQRDPEVRVTISSPFAVGVHEVTFAEWDACVQRGGCEGYQPEDQGWGRGPRPVINVSWNDIQAYLEWLSSETGQEYRLPTAAEWEYVARAGAGVEAAQNSEETDAALCREFRSRRRRRELAQPDWVGCLGKPQMAPVGTLKPNAFGLHDVLGNAWEWTEECRYDMFPSVLGDSIPRMEDCSSRQLRGGSSYFVGHFHRGLFLRGLSIDDRDHAVGFRVVRTIADSGGVDIALTDNGYAKLLLKAAWDDNLSLVTALLDTGMDPDADPYGTKPLFAAVNSASSGVVSALLQAGADPSARIYMFPNETPLYRALTSGPEDLERIVTVLLDAGADVNAQMGDGRTPLHAAVEHRRSAPVISTLLEGGADSGLTALQLAALQNDSATVDSLLGAGADPNEPDHVGWTPLHFAMFNDSPATVTSLIDAGADPNAQDAHGATPMIRHFDPAASDADPEGIVVRALLDAGADPNIAGAKGQTPLHFATRYGVRPAAVSALVDAGADPNALDESNDPPLMNHLRGNRETSKNREGSVAVVEALLKAGADPNLGTGFQRGSPLHEAIRYPIHEAIISLLLDAGADPFARDDNGQLPIDLVTERMWIRKTDVYKRLRALKRRGRRVF